MAIEKCKHKKIIIFIKTVMLEKVYSTFSLCFELLNETIRRLGYIINNPQTQIVPIHQISMVILQYKINIAKGRLYRVKEIATTLICKLNKVFHSTYVTAGFPKNLLIILAKVLTTQKKIYPQYHWWDKHKDNKNVCSLLIIQKNKIR